jgi:hypothetical protein
MLEPVYKVFPENLQVDSILEYRKTHLIQILKKHPVLVLVTGDTAKCVCAGRKVEDSFDFMFYKSKYAYADKTMRETEEMDDKHLLWQFPSTLAFFKDGVLQVVFSCNCFVFFLGLSRLTCIHTGGQRISVVYDGFSKNAFIKRRTKITTTISEMLRKKCA